MQYRRDKKGNELSVLGYGCMRFTKNGSSVDLDKAEKEMMAAIKAGVNYFDTAYVYAGNEAAVGEILDRNHCREQIYLATKLPHYLIKSVAGAEKMFQEELRRLKTDYIDYYLIHGVGLGGMDDLRKRLYDNGVLDFLLKERKAGRIRNLGWSFHGDVKVFDYLLSLDIPWDFVQIQLNYVDWKNASGWNVNAEYLYGELEKRNIPVVIMEPLLGGRLSRLNALSLAKLKQMRPDDSPASWAFRYAGSPKGVLTVLSGMVYMEHLQENIRTFSPLEPITEQENKALEEVTERMLHSDFVPCTECQYCMPCPYGLDIPGTFAHYNRCVNDELVAKSSQDANYREARRAFLVGYDRKVPKLRQAGHCIGCDKCVPKCPQGIKIPEQMRKIDQYVEQLKQETL